MSCVGLQYKLSVASSKNIQHSMLPLELSESSASCLTTDALAERIKRVCPHCHHQSTSILHTDSQKGKREIITIKIDMSNINSTWYLLRVLRAFKERTSIFIRRVISRAFTQWQTFTTTMLYLYAALTARTTLQQLPQMKT